MAVIGNAFDINRAKTSQSYAYQCWYNIKYQGNTLKVNPDDLKIIEQTWREELSNWIANANQDETAYDIPDDDFNNAYNKATQENEEKYGTAEELTGSNKQNNTLAGVSLGLTGAAIGADIGLSSAAKSACTSFWSAPNSEAWTNFQNLSSASENFGAWMVSAPLSMAVGILYLATRPNKDAKEALMQLKSVIENYTAGMENGQERLNEYNEAAVENAEKMEEENERINEELALKQERFVEANEIVNGIQARVNNGEKLSAMDKKLYADAVSETIKLGVELEELIKSSFETKEGLIETLEGSLDDYNSEAEFLAESQANIDFAASFDEATQSMAYIQGAMQTLNAAMGTYSAIHAGIAYASSFGFNFYALACVAMGTAGAVMSGIGAAEQFKWADEIATEIDSRKLAQGVLETSLDLYADSMNNFDMHHEFIEEFNFEDVQEFLETVNSFEATELPDEKDGDDPQTTGTDSNSQAQSNPFATDSVTTDSVSSDAFATDVTSGSIPADDSLFGSQGDNEKKKNPFA